MFVKNRDQNNSGYVNKLSSDGNLTKLTILQGYYGVQWNTTGNNWDVVHLQYEMGLSENGDQEFNQA